MTFRKIRKIVNAYSDELDNWQFFSDSQKAYITGDKKIVVCLRDYNWYITKKPVKKWTDCIKALFEIDWIAEYDQDEDYYPNNFITYSDYWEKY